MRVGQSWQSTADDDWRTLVQFNVTPLKDTKIISAAVLVNVWHTADCTPSPFQLWRTNAISKSNAVTWNNTKDKTWIRLAEVHATANKQSCPKGNDEVSFDQKAVRAAFQDAATKKYGTITFGFRAASEADELQWKKLKPGSTYLDINYNRRPGAPTGMSMAPCFEACSSPAVTSSRKPALKMKVSDPDGGKLLYQYQVYDAAKKTLKATSGSTMTGVASNASRSWTVSKSLPDAQYYWRGRACDSYLCGPYSGWFGLKIDATNPKLPTVSSEDYPVKGWHGGPGVAGNFTFSPGSSSDGVGAYYYTLNGGKESPPIVPGSDGLATVPLKPTRDLKNAQESGDGGPG
jgi:hypothetical protein